MKMPVLLTALLYKGIPESDIVIYTEMIKLFSKIDLWWIREIELPTSGEFTAEQYDDIDWDGVTSLNLQFLKNIAEVALTGNDAYLKIYKEIISQNGAKENEEQKNG